MKEKNKFVSILKSNMNNSVLVIMFAVVFVLMMLISPNFLSPFNRENILAQFPEFLLLTMSMMIVIMSGGINLANITSGMLASIVGLSAMNKMVEGGTSEGLAIFIGVVLAFLIATAVGIISGWLVGYLNIPAILVTLGMQQVTLGIGTVISSAGKNASAGGLVAITGFPERFSRLGNGKIGAIPISFLIAVAAIIIMYLLVHKTSFGFKVQMLGSSKEATEYSGINVKKELLKAYVLSSVLSCLAALIMCARYNQAKADNGNSYLMQTIVAAVIGGCSIDGGSGNLIGVVIAVAIIQILTNGLTVRGLDQSLIKVISALLLIITILVKRRFSFERKQDAKAKA